MVNSAYYLSLAEVAKMVQIFCRNKGDTHVTMLHHNYTNVSSQDLSSVHTNSTLEVGANRVRHLQQGDNDDYDGKKYHMGIPQWDRDFERRTGVALNEEICLSQVKTGNLEFKRVEVHVADAGKFKRAMASIEPTRRPAVMCRCDIQCKCPGKCKCYPVCQCTGKNNRYTQRNCRCHHDMMKNLGAQGKKKSQNCHCRERLAELREAIKRAAEDADQKEQTATGQFKSNKEDFA